MMEIPQNPESQIPAELRAWKKAHLQPAPKLRAKKRFPAEKVHFLKTLFFIILHIPLAYMMSQSVLVATAHVYLTLLIGLYVVIRKKYADVSLVVAYIVGSEVLWRMTQAAVFWEIGKYAVCAIFLLAILKRRGGKQAPPLALFYFALLLASSWLTLSADIPPIRIKNLLSSNLSGPLSLMMACWYFWKERFSVDDYFRIAIRIFAPLAGISFLCAYGIFLNPEITWKMNSLPVASGGFGPNQVSGTLGFGALLAFIIFLLFQDKKKIAFLTVILMFLFLSQSALTFSRSGIYFALISAFSGSLFLIRDRKIRVRFLLAVIILFAAAYFIIPRLNALTEGMLAERFADSGTTGRWEFALSDLKHWGKNIVFGIGPGMGSVLGREGREGEMLYIAAHTEFTRALGEHGLFGLVALICLMKMFWKRIRCEVLPVNKSLVVMLGIFTFLYMLASAMRTALPGFTFGLMLAYVIFEQKKPVAPK